MTEMTEEQYREYLVALAKRHLRMDRALRHLDRIGWDISNMKSTALHLRLDFCELWLIAAKIQIY